MMINILLLLLLITRITHSKQLRENDHILQTTTTKRRGLSVGTVRGVSNAAKNGSATRDYDFMGNRNHVVPAGEHVTNFYVFLDYSEVGDDRVEIGRPEVRTSLPGECVAYVAPGTRGEINSQDSNAEIDVIYTCHKETRVDVELTVPIVGYAPVILQWTKLCEKREMEDLDVSFIKSLPEMENNRTIVVSEGKVNEKWENASYTFSGQVLELAFQLSSRRTIPADSVFKTIGSISASANPPIAMATSFLVRKDKTWISLPSPNVTSTLDLAAQEGQDTIDFRVHLECLANGSTEILVKIRSREPFDPYGNTKFRFGYTCSGPHPQLLVSSSQKHVMTQERLSDDDADVAKHGILRPRWLDEKNFAMTLDEQQDEARFFYALSPHNELAGRTLLTMLFPDVHVSENQVANCNIETASSSIDSIPDALSTTWRSIAVRCICKTFKSSKTIVTVSLRPTGYDPIDIRYMKKCGGHKWGANVRVMGSQFRVQNASDDNLELPEWVDVVRNGVTTSLWQKSYKIRNAIIDSSISERGTSFNVVLGVRPPSYPISLEIEESLSEKNVSTSSSRRSASVQDKTSPTNTYYNFQDMQRIGPVEVSVSNRDILDVSLMGSLVVNSKENWLHLDQPYGLNVKYDCKEKGKEVLVEITIPLLEPRYEPLVFSFYYYCETWLESIGL